MKKIAALTFALTLALTLGTALVSQAQDKTQRYECALIKWDGGDKVVVNLPDKSEILHVWQLADARTPKEMPDEEFCLAFVANRLAKEGWEMVNLDSRRILLRRSAASR